MPKTNQTTAFNYQVGSNPVLQIFTSSGVWKKPSGATMVRVCAWGGGGGGGSGPKANSIYNLVGGQGGQAGSRVHRTFAASALPDFITVTIGAGGCGGASRAANTGGAAGAVGFAGSCGGVSLFGSYVRVPGGRGGGRGYRMGFESWSGLGYGNEIGFGPENFGLFSGSGAYVKRNGVGFGQSVVGRNGCCSPTRAAGATEFGGAAGGLGRTPGFMANNAIANGGSSLFGATGGGGGGSASSTTIFVGGAGGGVSYCTFNAPFGAPASTTSGQPGTDGIRLPTGSGGGGGGGYAAIGLTDATRGGHGGLFGGGGGGGGATFGCGASGAGGNGAPGGIIVYSW